MFSSVECALAVTVYQGALLNNNKILLATFFCDYSIITKVNTYPRLVNNKFYQKHLYER